MRSCEEYEELISEFLDGELSKDEQIELMKHMAVCRVCQKYFDDLVAMHEALEVVEEAPVPEGFSDRVMSRVHETKQEAPAKVIPFPYWKRWAALAACCALAAGLWVFQGRKGDQDSLQAAVTTNMPYVAGDAASSSEGDAGDGIALLEDAAEVEDESAAYRAAAPEEDMETGYYENSTRDSAAPETTQETAPQEYVRDTRPVSAPTSSDKEKNSLNSAQAAPEPASAPPAPSGGASLITADDAKNIALTHAGLTADEAAFTQAKLEWEDGRQVYDVEFYTAAGAEYDYEIDAVTGAVVKYDYDAESYTPAPPETAQTITADDAKNIALAHANLTAGEVTFTKAKLDWEDGKQVYEIDFYTPAAAYDSAQRTEYDYEIDAGSGSILKYDYDVKSTGLAPSAPAGEKLTREAAQELALAQVPGAAAEHITKLKLDRDDGRELYEVEIIYGGVEYEMELDAYTGAVLDFEAEAADRW